MKKVLTVLAIFMSMLCSSIILVSCSNDYKKMYLVVEYALPTEDGQNVEWKQIESNGNFDYTLSQGVYSNEDSAYVLYLRVKVKGISKKVDSLYISQSANNATILDGNTVKPDEAFKVLVKNIGSVTFNVIPSNGGEDKAVSFGVNIYRELTDIKQSTDCVPALVTGGYVRLESLNNLIKYYPYDDVAKETLTNQTGVDYSIESIGTLVNNGGDNLIDRTFVLNEEFESTGLLAENKNNKNQYVQLSNASGHLMLNVSTGYKLTNSNNVIKLLATSKYNPEIKTSVYVYIVENFTSTSLLVSYSDSVLLDNTGNLPTQTEISQPISDTATIYNSLIDNDTYNYIKLYTYTNASIYSYESNPGIKLSVYVNGVNYNYNDVVDNTLGIQISPVHKDVNGESKLIGLKFEVNPNANSTINTYNIRLELDFTAFDFSASDKTPVSVLNKEFTINVESLASGFHINGKGYSDNLDALLNGQESTITEYNSTQPAKLYTHYTQSAIGLPLNIQATPTNAVDTKVYVSFYEDYKFESGQLVLENNLATKVQLLESSSFGLPSTNGEYQIDFANKNKLVYLKLNEKEDISALQKIYMVCKVVCTPESFGLNTVEQKYITFVAKIDVVGSVNNIYVYKQSSDNVANNTLTDTYLANNTENVAYINLNSTSNNVNLSEITITSTNGNIKYSADRVNWVESITAENLNTIMGGTYKTLYFRTVKECDDSIIISSPNGIKNQLDYTFVNVTSSADNVKLEYDSPYVWESQTIDKVGISDVTDAENVDLKYLALQSGATVQFKAYGDNRNANIKSVTATSLMQSNAMYSKITKGGNSVYNSMTSFSDSAIKVLNSPSYLFDVQANSVGFTAVMLVEVKFYVNVLNADGVTGSADDSVYTIVERSKYFVYEVAVYTPAKDLEVTTDKDLIVYVNEHYLSSAKVEFEVALNKATQRIQFSSNAVNESINLSYGETGEASIYGISVTTNATMTDGSGNPYFQINDLNRYQYEIGGQIKNEYFVKNTTRKFSIQALQGLSGLGQDSIYVDITIYQFGTQTIYQIRKVIYFGDYEKADGIVVDGVDNYNNLYLSLLSGNTASTTIYASVSNQSATYKDLGYNIFLLDEDTNLLIDYRGSNLSITHNPEDDSFEINATNKGGIYQLELFAKDSYDAEINDYKVKFNIRITVSDGKTETTAYLISSLSEFETIATNSQNYYRLAKDIDISALSKTNWWDKERQFAGFLDGAITINDPNTGNVIYKCYSLIGLKISEYKTVSDVTCFGLFNSVTGTIKNITFDRVTFDVALNNENTSSNNPVNIGAVTAINNGTIENCSVNIVASEVVIKSYIENADGSTTDISAENTNYNIGLIAGINNKTISYNNTNLGSNYAYMTDCYSAGKLTVTVQAGNSKFTNSTNLNVGAVVGQNGEKGTISATYEDGSTQSIRTLISAVSNIEVLVDYDESHAPMTINSALGGIAGLNAGTITKVAVSGRLVANDKVNLGGIAGVNTGKVQECTNYGAYIEGRILHEDYTYTYAGGITKSNIYHSFTDDGTSIDLEQNIGGIIGFNNAGIVDNTRTMFIVFDSNEVSIEASRAQIVGVGNVGGVIGKATNTQLTRAYVENFVSDGENELNYNIIGVNANVAGLVAYSANSSANLSFVQADFNVGDSIFYEFGKNLDFKYVYFIGDVLSNNIENNELKEHNIATIYSYIVNTVIYLDAEGKIAIQANEYGVDDITLNSDFEIAGFTASWRKSEQESINNKYPYLVYTVDSKDVYTLTIRPSEIIVNVDENYFDSDAVEDDTVKFERYETTEGDSQDGLYIQYKNNDQVSATAVVYYVANGNNTHKLVSEDTDKGLIEKAILPSISSGVYSVNIISGAQIASLTDGDATITFYGVGKVVLKFASLYDTKVQDTVTIFVENPLHQDTFTLTTGTGLEDRTGQGERFTTRVGVNSLINVGLKDVNGQTFDATKTYMSAKVDNANIKVNGVTTEIADDKLSEYFTFAPKTKEIVAGSGKYVLGQFEMSAIKLDSSYSYLEIPITISVYLNLNKYLINDVALDTLMENTEALLEQRTITIIIYNKATNLTVSSDVKVESGVGVNINAELITGYINTSIESGNPSYTVSGTNGNKLLLEVAGQDKIDLTLTAVNDNAKDLLKVAKNNASNPQEFGVWDLFETIVTYTKLDDNSGYDYNINLKLKKEYRYLDLKDYTDGEWRFELEISANSNSELKKTVDVWFVPQQLTSFRLENYSNLVSRAGEVNGTTESEFKSNEAESSLIIPGESGLIKIFAEYDYSYFENISITSTTQVIDGKEYFIRYQQMVYNKEKGVYQSYAGITADGETLNLKKISYSDGSYDGIIFVRTILENIVGVRKTFTITVNATTYDSEGNSINVSRSKTVISQYRPGVYISVDNALSTQHDSEQVYLVEQNSSVTNIVARVYGYEFNVQPLITISPVNGGDVIAGDVTLIKQGDIYKDNTGAYVITYSLAVYTDKPFAVSMKMTLIENGNELSETSKTLTFYPVPYILNDVYLKGEANGGLNINVNSSKDIELVWSTKVTTNAKIESINNEINKLDYLKLFYINATDGNGRDYNKHFTSFLNTNDTNFSIKQNNNGTYRIEALIKSSAITVHFNLWYGYAYNAQTGKFEVRFATERDESKHCTELLAHDFNLQLSMATSEDAPEPITTQADLMAMSEGENYILMNDITLENWVPLNTAIASLDGNGKLINIKSFDISVSASMNVGLFNTISADTIIKNVAINISTLENNLGTNETVLYIIDDNIANATINFGLLAGVNQGLVYNCEVVSIKNSRKLKIDIGSTYNLTFGGLVGVNQGNITNSRVGTEYFEKLEISGGSAISSIISCGTLYFESKGIMAGLVGQNDANCIISSSYVTNTTVENTSNNSNSIYNRTAGFVATNNGLVAYSYVKGLERSIIETRARATGSMIYASGAGSVAGFVYYNAGEVHDCYSNIICKSSSVGVAGFVYNNLTGSVVQCYSASTVESGSTSTTLATELPFVGVGYEKEEAKLLLSNDKLVNCYYLLEENSNYDTNYIVPVGAITPTGISLTSFANANNLNNYSFISDNATEQQLNGVWTYSTGIDKNRSTYSLSVTNLPELTSANKISRSLRDYDETSTEGNNYKYISGYELGSATNPYIIRNADEYKSIFVDSAYSYGNKKYQTGYVRFIDNISFETDSEYVNIDTRSNYVLGDQNNNTFTLIDGNGMTISDVVINYAESETGGNLGLFSEVYYSVIKGLNIEYASKTNTDGSQVGSSTATYVGGVAGIAKNTYFIDINLSGSVTLRAHNVVGGVVGRLTGSNSGLYNITTDLNVQAGNYSDSNIYSSESTEVAYLSYAGGIAGIIDIGNSNNNENNFNVNKLTVNASNVRANRAGGIAGFMGANVNAKRLTYVVSGSSQILGREVAGGIVADNFADIQLSQANRDIDEQYNYDKAFGEYINNDNLVAIDNLTNSIYGNLNAVTGQQIVGGFIGINYAGNISNSLTKANIGYNDAYGLAEVVGGFIGKTYGGNLQYVYAQNYIDMVREISGVDGNSRTYRSSTVGGLVGYVADEANNKITTLNGASKYFGLDNVVTANWFDKSQVELLNADQVVDYIVGKLDTSVTVCKRSSDNKASPIVSYGVYNADSNNEAQYSGGKIQNGNIAYANHYDMEALYYTSTNGDNTGASTAQDIFETLFATWEYSIWEKDYTKFMPNLKLDTATDYIVIDEEADLVKLEQFPDRNFVLAKDLYLSDKYSNYVVNANFEGILIGSWSEETGRYTGIYGIKLNANTSNDLGSGFFKQTTNARIANINFGYEYIELNGGEYVHVGGVSAYDYASSFEQIEVKQSSSVVDASIKTINNASVVNLGSIVGEGYRSKILSCSSELQYNVNCNEVTTANAIANIGGLVGMLDGYYYDTEEHIDRYEGLIASSTYSGKITVTSNEGVYVGGIIESAKYTRISDSKVFIENETENVEIQLLSTNNNYIGGIIATSNMCSVSDCIAEVTVCDKEIKADVETIDDVDTDTTYYVGGITGYLANESKVDKDIENSYAKLTYNLIKTNNAYIGGIVGHMASNNSAVLNRLASEITIKVDDRDDDEIVVVGVVDNMVVGGIVGLTSGNVVDGKALTINDSMAIMNCNIEYNSSLVGGGIIGKATGSYSINNSTAMGQLFANNELGVQLANRETSTLTVLGGLVGLAGDVNGCVIAGGVVEQEINNTYSALTISMAGVYRGDTKITANENDVSNIYSHDVIANALVGYTDSSNTITGKGVVYSSDYNLTFDDNTVFENQPTNVTANVLINSNTTLQPNTEVDANPLNGYIGSKWIWKQGYLPMPSELQNLLTLMGIVETQVDSDGNITVKFVQGNEGSAYNPIMFKEGELNNYTFAKDDEYKYYLLSSSETIGNSLGSLNGVVLGNNNIISTTTTIFGEIAKHSAISNLTVNLTVPLTENSQFTVIDGEGKGGVANINNGTIFMLGVQYDNNLSVPNKFGGIVGINNGLISNCYNMGNTNVADSVTDVGGLAYHSTENASIEDSYFTGSFTSVDGDNKTLIGAALAFTNQGNVSNCYSAGMATHFIGDLQESLDVARYENLYFDYYANYTTTDVYKDLETYGIIGKSTREMQVVTIEDELKTSNSALLSGWKVYSMYNWDDLLTADATISTTYNYGYPIHNIQQLKLDGTVKPIEVRVKQTGNGSFNAFMDDSGNYIIDSGYLNKNARGKIVSTLDATNGTIYYDSFPFLINNLGVLHLVNEVDDTSNKYFELEIDIILPLDNTVQYKESDENNYQLLSNWSGIGTASHPFAGVFTTSASVEDGNYTLDRTLLDETIDEYGINFNNDAKIIKNDAPKTIANLNGSALFNYVENGAVITNVILEDSRVSTAPLIENVGTTDADYLVKSNFAPVVFNVKVDGSVTTNSTGSISGLVNNINLTDTLNLHSIDTSIEIVTFNEGNGNRCSTASGVINTNSGTVNVKNSFKSTNVTMTNATITTVAGFINQNLASGVINLVDGISITLNSKENNEKSINGFVVENFGTILTLGETSSVKVGEIGKTATYIAGLVGLMQNGVVGGFDVTFEGTEGDEYQSQVFGGVVAYLYGGQVGQRGQDVDGNNRPINVTLATATTNNFGGVVAHVAKSAEDAEGVTGSISNVIIKSVSEQIVVKQLSDSEANSYGLIIGRYEQALGEINYELNDETIFKVDSKNVGGIIGIATNGTFNFVNEMPAIINVFGTGNVGGFIGQYAGETSLVMNGNTWLVDEQTSAGNQVTGFANVGIFMPTAPKSGKVAAQASNFGGLIGYWNSTADLKCENEEGELLIVNNNQVLTFDNLSSDDQNKIDWFKNTVKGINQYDYMVSNIGGVVGYANASITNAKNNATVGFEIEDLSNLNEHESNNPISGTSLTEGLETPTIINQFMQFMYIGGVAGCVEGQNITITNCSNTSSVYGMYAVGGVIGGALSDIAITFDDMYQVVEESVTIAGFADIGGTIGKAQGLTLNTSIEGGVEIMLDYVVGITNVGGIAGYATNANISNLTITETTNAIVGNLNVGGVVGYATSGEIINTTVKDVKVYGTAFDYKYEVWNTEEGKNKLTPFYYLPTNIGGIAGYIGGESKFSKVTANADVMTDEKFLIDGDGNETVVNIASNYIGSIADISNKKTISVEMGKQFVSYLESYYGTASVKGESVDGGIGGFAGRLNSPNFMTVDEDGASASAYSECQVLGSVYAPLGINVGGVIGYLNHDQAIELPILPQSQDTNGDNVIDDTDEAFNVAGKLYVGGYIGKNNGFTSATTEFFKLNPTGYVNIQQYVDADNENQVLSGNYIGGIIGYSTGEVNNIKLVYNADTNPKAKIKVFNSNSGFIDSSYVGALVGRIDTNMYGCEISAEFCDAENGYYEYDTVAGIIQSPKVYNYGGLVGVVDVPTDSKGSNGINILGKHYYPFTVEMVQNRDYLQGQTQYDYTDDTLTAIAHYINMSDINVSASALKSLFDGKEDSLARDDHNPTNTLANGWAKEYTMFRMVARVIEQPDEPTGDSVQVIYSANYITEVECTYKDYSEDIIYTIYQPLGQVAQLYCKYGIARESVDFKPNNDEGTVAYEKDYMVTLEGDRSAWTWKNEAGDTDRHAFWTNVKDLTGLGVTGSQITDGMKTQVETLATTHQRTLGSSYYVNDNYLSKDKTYFEFILVFGFIKNADGDAEEDISLYSKSGSLFEVTGTVSNIAIEGVKERQEAWKGWRIIAGVGVVLLALMAFSPLGGIVIGAISKVLFALKIYASASTIIGAVGAFLITVSGTAMIQSLDTSYTTVLNSYLGIQDKSMGYLYSAYGRQITWNNGELNPYMDSYIVINVDNIKINGTNIDTSRYQGNNYNQFLLDGMNIDSTNKTCTLPLTYFNCSSSLALPSNINQSMTVLVEDMQDSDVKTIFEEIGIESYEVPMYRVVDNELYVYSSDAIVGKTLYPNYADAKDLIKELEIDEYQLIDKNGYAYLLINLDNTNEEYIVPAGDAEYLYTTYGIDRIVQEYLTHSISKSSSGATKQVILSELRWTAKIGHVDTLDTLQFNTTFKYAGTDSPTGVYSVYRNAINDNGDIYYLNESGAYVSVQDGTPYNGELSANTTAYFTLNGTGSASINVTLTPKRGGNGLTSNDLGVTGDYYYVYAEGGKFNIPCDFGLCNKTQFNVGNSAYVYDKTSLDIGDEYLEATKITIYSYNPEKGDAESISDFFGAGITISLSELQKNYSDYCDYSMSNTHYDAVSNNYILDGNKLVLKTINSRYLVDSSTGTPYVYLPTYGGIDSPANYNNRYVYYTTVDGKNIKFYTRFKYDGKYTPADGIPKTIKFLEDESISSRLIPDKIEDVNKNILFTEGVRVSLSAGNQRIYTIYESTKNNVWINATYGTLSCDDSHL